MPNTNTQIEQLLAKIAEKKLSNDKLDLWLLEHWQNELLKLKYEVILTKDTKGLNPNR